MSTEIVKVSTRAQLKKFITFPEVLYKNCENWVPALRGDEFDTFNPKTNGAYEFCEADCFLAYKDGVIAGRVAAIINHKANQLWNTNSVRFGWLDFIEDEEVLRALINTVASWGKERGCDSIKGPLGFTDMDKEGLLVEGYENLSPFTCLYNYPYYDTLLTGLGFVKDTDWTQRISTVPSELVPMLKYADIIEQKYGLHMYKGRNMFEMCRKYGMSLFHMVNASFAPLFQFTPLTDKQIRRYLQTYIPILSPDFVNICLNDREEPVGFIFSVPSLSKAVKKSGGRLLPFGLFRILRALKHNDTLEALMIGVLPEYQGKGAPILMIKQLQENCLRFGIKHIVYNPQLEDNIKVQNITNYVFPARPFMRRRAYTRNIQA